MRYTLLPKAWGIETIDTQEGPQTRAAESKADIVIFGGAAGGGKSYWLSLEMIKYAHVPGYVGLLMRRNYTDLVGPGTIWQETRGIYPYLGGQEIGSPLHWRFPADGRRAEVWGKHLAHEKDLEKLFQGTQPQRVGIDELTHWSERAFWFIWGRCRSTSGVRPALRATCNPDPDSFVKRLISWWLDEDGFPIPERSGQLRWFIRVGSIMEWADDPAHLHEFVPEGEKPEDYIASLTFIGSKVTDNRKMLDKDPKYRARLHALPPVDQARYLGGNWNVRPAQGDFFQRGWVHPLRPENPLTIEPDPARYIKRVRCYDFASTPVQGCLVPGVDRPVEFSAHPEGHKADWSASVLMCECAPHLGQVDVQTQYVIEHVKRYRDTPGAIRQWVRRQAQLDGPGTVVALFVDPGQAGVDQIEAYTELLRDVCKVVPLPTRAPGAIAATPAKQQNAQAIAAAAYNGQIWYRNQPEMLTFFNELEQFPNKDVHDDYMDALSGAFRGLKEIPNHVFGYVPVRPEPFDTGDRDRYDDDLRVGGTAGFEKGF